MGRLTVIAQIREDDPPRVAQQAMQPANDAMPVHGGAEQAVNQQDRWCRIPRVAMDAMVQE
jgi:hypothetical protein